MPSGTITNISTAAVIRMASVASIRTSFASSPSRISLRALIRAPSLQTATMPRDVAYDILCGMKGKLEGLLVASFKEVALWTR